MIKNAIDKEYDFDEPLIHEIIDSLFDNCIRDCQKKYFHTLDHLCVYVINLTNITNNEIFNLTITGKSTKLYELNK